jgi:RND family efflux transporter MFP subunit
MAPPEVNAVAVSSREIGIPHVLLRVTGYLAARRQITVSSMAQGKIVTMPVVENQQVEEGALLARLENREQQANLRLVEAHLEEARLDHQRIRRLFEQGTVSGAERDHATTALQVAQAQAELARVALAYTEIRAPIKGTVIRKLRDVGEFLTIGVTASGDPGTAVVTLADLSAMFVELEINETEIHKVKIGDVAIVAPEALRDRRYLADVTEVAATANRQKGMVAVKLRVREPDAHLKPEMTASVSFLAGEPKTTVEVMPALPASAVVERDGRRAVFVIENDKVTAVPVEARLDGDGYAALLHGPAEGTYVVENPPMGLQSGQSIRLRTP